MADICIWDTDWFRENIEKDGYDFERTRAFAAHINATRMRMCPRSEIREHYGWQGCHPRLANNRDSVWCCSVLEWTEEFGLVERIFASKIVKFKRNPAEIDSLHSPYGEVRIHEVMAIPCDDGKICPLCANCYYLTGGFSSGFYAYGFNGKGETHFDTTYIFDPELSPTNIKPAKVARWELFASDEVLADGTLRYAAYKPNNRSTRLPEYARLYRRHPVAEMFAKLGLWHFLGSEANMRRAEKSKTFLKFVHRNAERIKREHLPFGSCWGAFKSGEDIGAYRERVWLKRQLGKEIASYLSYTQRDAYKEARKHATAERIRDYVEKTFMSYPSYFDYLEAAHWLKLDFSDTKVLFPRNWFEAHDDYTTQYANWKREQAEARRLAEQKEQARLERLTSARMLRTAEKAKKFLLFSNGGYFVIVAETKDDLINEGAAQSNCVGKMGYDRKQADGKSVICFVRSESEPEKSLVTAEVALKGGLKISQFYLARNQVAEGFDDFKDAWMASAKTLKRANKVRI